MLSGLSFYLVPKLLASDLILTVDAAAGKAGIWPGGSLQNSEFISGDTFLLPTCLRGRDKRAPRLCLCLAVYLLHGHGSRPRKHVPQATAGLLGTEPSRGCPASGAVPRHCRSLCLPAPAFTGAVGTGRSFNPLLVATPTSSLLLCPNQSRRCPWLSSHAFSAKLCRVPQSSPGPPGDTSGVRTLTTSWAEAGLQGEQPL